MHENIVAPMFMHGNESSTHENEILCVKITFSYMKMKISPPPPPQFSCMEFSSMKFGGQNVLTWKFHFMHGNIIFMHKNEIFMREIFMPRFFHACNFSNGKFLAWPKESTPRVCNE